MKIYIIVTFFLCSSDVYNQGMLILIEALKYGIFSFICTGHLKGKHRCIIVTIFAINHIIVLIFWEIVHEMGSEVKMGQYILVNE